MTKKRGLYAKFYRIVRGLGFGLALLGGAPLTYAAYAQLTPPPGWSAGGGAFAELMGKPVSGTIAVSSEAGAAGFDRLISRNVATLAGEKVPVALAVERTAAQRMLAGRIGVALASGAGAAVFTGGLSVAAMLAVPIVAEWWKNTEFEWDGKQWWRKKTEGNKEYWLDGGPTKRSAQAACETAVQLGYTNPRVVESDALYCVASRGGLDRALYIRSQGVENTIKVPADYQNEVRPALEATSLPEKLPNIVWPASWPVSDPIINPDSSGKPSPLFIPTGSPVKNPDYDPSKPVSVTNQPYLQPGIRVVPAPTADNPWRVDAQPVNKPVGSTDEPPPEEGEKPATDSDLCEKHPDILACSKPDLDTPDGDIPKATKNVSYEPEILFGGGACPSDKFITTHGFTFKAWNWVDSCDWIVTYVRPMVIAACALVALAILTGGTKT